METSFLQMINPNSGSLFIFSSRMMLFCHGLLLPLHLACRGKWRVHKCASSHCWRKPNQPQHFCSSSSPFTPDCQSRSTKHSTLQTDQEPHTPVLLKEVMQYMDIKPGQVRNFCFSICHNLFLFLENLGDVYMAIWSDIKAQDIDVPYCNLIQQTNSIVL